MNRIARSVLIVCFAVAVLAPWIASDRPLLASVGGELRAPALAEVFGGRSEPPPGGWREWWLTLDDREGDWAVMPPWLHDPIMTDSALVRAGPSFDHPLGNDATGRDQLARLVHGARTAMLVAIGAALVALAVGVPIGALAGLLGGVTDTIALRLIEVFACFPALVAVLAVAAFVGESRWIVVVVLGLAYWPTVARLVRGELLSLREREFVVAARMLGVRPPALLVRHVLPCVRGPILVAAAFLAADAIVVESTLTFLGLGSGSLVVSWGRMLADGRADAALGAWHLWLFPALALVTVVLSLHAVARPARR